MRFSLIYLLVTIGSFFASTYVTAAVVGIDYGQQFLKAMVVSPQAPMELILTPESKRKDVSGLAIRKYGSSADDIERFFGSAVGSLSTRFPKDTLLHLKPLLGKASDEMSDTTLYLREHPGVEIVQTDRNTVAFKVHGVQYTVEELSAMNIQEIVNRANALLKEKDPSGFDYVDRLAFTVPDFFDQHQRKALLDVGALTTNNPQTCLVHDGLSVLINFAFKIRDFIPGERYYYVVYDIGAGSTKASLFSILQPLNETEPLTLEFGGYGFNHHLGGSKFTLDVASLIENKFLEVHKNIRTDSLHANPKALSKIIQAAEKAKLVLSANSEASVSIESLIDGIDFKTTITRSEFEDYIEDCLLDIIYPIEHALDSQLWEGSVSLEDLSGVILTGGSSRVPAVQQQLSKLVNEGKILRSVNADESAVNGATVRGIKIFDAFKTKPLNIVERTIYDYSIKAKGETTEELVFPKGSSYPDQITLAISSSKDITEGFNLDLYENDKIFKTVSANTKSLEKTFSSESCPFGIVYNVTFSLSQNRLFDVDKVEGICLKATENDLQGKDKQISDEKSDFILADSKSHRTFKLAITREDVPIKHLSLDQKYRARKHIALLVEKDRERFELEAAKNLLEGLLYDTREYLETSHVIEKGPKLHLEKLAEIIPDYLEWLEEDANTSKKVDIEDKVAEVKKLRSKIETYLNYFSEPLNAKQFEEMIEEANELLANMTKVERSVNDTLMLVENRFTEFDVNVQEEFSKISLPSSISKSLSGWNETIALLKEQRNSIRYLLDSTLLEETDREILLEIKLEFDEACIDMRKKIVAFEMGRDYRFRELLSTAQRLEKARKRKEEKLKKSMAEEEKSTASLTMIDSIHDSKTVSSSCSTNDKTSAATSAETSILHDEL